MTTTIDYGTLFAGVKTEALDAIQAVLPLAVAVMAVIVGVTIGAKVIKKLSK